MADGVRRRYGRGLSVLGQDVMRRNLLREKKDLPGGLAPSFITHSAGFLLNAGWPVIIEGILSATFYAPALRELIAAHRGQTLVYFLRVELIETFTRHASRPEAAVFSTAEMAAWFEPVDRLDVAGEIVITHVCTRAAGHTSATTSGSPFNPSQTTKNTSFMPRFFKSCNTCNQNFAPSPPGPAQIPRTSLRPSSATPIAA